MAHKTSSSLSHLGPLNASPPNFWGNSINPTRIWLFSPLPLLSPCSDPAWSPAWIMTIAHSRSPFYSCSLYSIFSTKPEWISLKVSLCCSSAQNSPMREFIQKKIQSLHDSIGGPTGPGPLLPLLFSSPIFTCSCCSVHTVPLAASWSYQNTSAFRPLHWLLPWSGTFSFKICAELTSTPDLLWVLSSISFSYKTLFDHILQTTTHHCHSHHISTGDPYCTSASPVAPLDNILRNWFIRLLMYCLYPPARR